MGPAHIRMTEVPEDCFIEIIQELEEHPLPVNKYRDKAGEGRSAAFGFVNRRSAPVDISRLCWLRAGLYKKLLDLGTRICPFEFDGITINQNYKAAPHRDKGNVGESFLVAFGDYQGGELQILEGDLSGTYGIRHAPVLFDGSKYLHAVRPWTGARYSLVFYRLAYKAHPTKGTTKKLSQYQPVQDAKGKWVLEFTDLDGNRTVYKRGAGLPHPIRDFKERQKAASAESHS
jgi:hypothetical protein